MRLRQIVGNFLGAIEFVASMLYILEKFGIPVVLPPLPSSGPMFDILLLLVIVGAVGLPVWIGYQIHGWRSKKGSSNANTGLDECSQLGVVHAGVHDLLVIEHDSTRCL